MAHSFGRLGRLWMSLPYSICRIVMILTIFCWCLPLHVSRAQDETVLTNGKGEYERHCASCHGVSATGNGAMAAFLTIKPADLTHLSEKNDGKFPFWHTYNVIDGRQEVMAHGSRRMPVWGSEFMIEEGDGTRDEDRVLGRILALVYYLQSIQERS